ncbi:MAG: PfkB family carbohydrate kinase, partial [Chloroflexota bacterium]
MIVTITLNAALDRTLVAPGFTLGQSRTVDRALSLGGGKGLNVARALHGLSCAVLALGLAGGETGAAIRRVLAEEGIPSDLTQIREESRTCTAIIDPLSGLSTEINEPGPRVAEDELAPFLDRFQRVLSDASLIALSGS